MKLGYYIHQGNPNIVLTHKKFYALFIVKLWCYIPYSIKYRPMFIHKLIDDIDNYNRKRLIIRLLHQLFGGIL